MTRKVLTLAIVLLLSLALAPAYAAAETVAFLNTDGVAVEMAEEAPLIVSFGFNGVHMGYKYVTDDNYYLLGTVGLGNHGFRTAAFIGTRFESNGYLLDGRVGVAVAGGKVRFLAGIGLVF